MRLVQVLVWLALLAFPLAGSLANHGPQEPFPSRTIKLVVPFPPGGGSDGAARLIAERWSARLGARVEVENRPGGSGTVGTDAVAKAHPDGHTIGLNAMSLAANPSLKKSMPFDTARDLVPVGTVATTPLILVVNPSVPARSLAELLALIRAQPGRLSLAMPVSGATLPLPLPLSKELSAPRVLVVPYRGGGPALVETIGGQVDIAVSTLPAVLPHVRAERLRAVALVAAERSPLLPGVPTVVESEPQDDLGSNWYIVVAPAGTPQAAVERLNRTLDETLREPDLVDQMVERGYEPWVSSPSQVREFVRTQLDRWARTVRERGTPPG